MDRFVTLADQVDTGDREVVAAELASWEPAACATKPDVLQWCREQADRLIGGGAARALRELPAQSPLTDRAMLAAVKCPVLVIAQEADEVHPVSVARDVVGALPHAQLELLPEGGIMWAHRDRVRGLVGDFVRERAA